jgi:hypothetical protein
MTRLFWTTLAFALVACEAIPDDVNDETDASTDETPAPTDDDPQPTDDVDPDPDPAGGSIVGEWLSEGDDLAPLLAEPPSSILRVVATFEADGDYAVAVDTQTQSFTLTGTYTTGNGTTPATIALDQAEPFRATAEGIWQVQGATLTYEVAQTVPDQGFDPPTPAGGFGSTGGADLAPRANVQIYRKQ